MTHDSLLQPGRNCWKILRADHLAFLIDGEAYFDALVQAAQQARRSILLLGWDFHSGLRLRRDGNRETPSLRDFLNGLVEQRPSLHIHMLEWDWSEIYTLEREFLPALKLDWQTHERFHFRLDDSHPVGASHHQKVVVVDDAVAFVGGLDLTKSRWDTSEHAPGDSRRKEPDGTPYGPFHDIQAMVSGEAAAALGDLARERWLRATGEKLEPPEAPARLPWPRGVEAVARDVPVAIARTAPAHLGRPAVDEVATFHADAIAAARRFLYIENQYFTSRHVADALERRLREEDGPEIVLVLPRRCFGWLEQSTMGVLRETLVHRLLTADRHGRLRIYYPQIPALEEYDLNLHAKVLVVDDRLAKIGSSNLSNRSMGFDTECDLILEADGDPVEKTVASLRNRLLAEHLGTEPGTVADVLDETGSLIRTVEALRTSGRTLRPLEVEDPSEWGELASRAVEWADPAEPIDMEGVVHELAGEEEDPSGQGREKGGKGKWKWIAAGALLLALTAVWRWTPLGEYLQPERIGAALHYLSEEPLAPVYVVGGYVVGAVLSAPITLLIIATSLIFGVGEGFAYAMLGIAASAAVTYAAGRYLGRGALERVAPGSTINQVNRYLSRRGLWATIVIRNVPVAPFTLVNVIAGASRIRFRDYLLGTLLGMAPGTLAIMLLERSITQAFEEPGAASFALLAAIFLAVGVGAYAFRRWLRRQEGEGESP